MTTTKYLYCAAFYLALLCSVSSSVLDNEVGSKACFKDSFMFGVATSSYQVEGAWNVSGKGESIWDRLTHEHPEIIFDHSNGDVADSCYYKVKEDVRLMKEFGINLYRFSVSWPRILPNGLSYKVNEDGIRYYNELIDELIHNNITPALTMYHWDLPQYLGYMGGWYNPVMVDYFVEYARILLDNFGSKVKLWMTFNEPLSICGRNEDTGVQDYMCGHNILRAHGMVYRMFDEKYRDKIGGEMSIALSFAWGEPDSDSKEDQIAAETSRQFRMGWFANPIFSEAGDYPPIMRSIVDENSKRQGFPQSRLPYFTPDEVKRLRGSWDYLALNHYTTAMIRHQPKRNDSEPSYSNDVNVYAYPKDEWPRTNTSWLRVVPWGFRKALNWIKLTYNNPKVLVTENGMSTKPGLSDTDRISYIDGYLRAMHSAIYEDGCNVMGYTYWSFLDNFEWARGYSERFGLFEVDYTSPNRTRTPRLSAEYFANIAKTGCLPDSLAEYSDYNKHNEY